MALLAHPSLTAVSWPHGLAWPPRPAASDRAVPAAPAQPPSLPPSSDTHGSEDTEPELGHRPEAPRQAGPRRSSQPAQGRLSGWQSRHRGFALPLCPALAPLGLSVGHPLALDFRLAEVGSAGHPPAMQACPSWSEPSSAGGWSDRRDELPDLGGVQGRQGFSTCHSTPFYSQTPTSSLSPILGEG